MVVAETEGINVGFGSSLKRLQFDIIEEREVDWKLLHAQYNPDRFKYYRQTVTDSSCNILGIGNSPHVKLLKDWDRNWDTVSSTAYFLMQKLYGRKPPWIQEKITAFLDLFDRIKSGGEIRTAEILSKPVRKNKYNSGYEIWEGHHRVACHVVLDLPVPCIIKAVR